MNEIWELSTTYNMEQWKHDKMAAHNFFLIRAVDGGRTGRARNLKICRDTVDSSLRNLQIKIETEGRE